MPISWPAVGACVLPHIGGWIGGLFVARHYDSWYKNLKKPSWNPPKYVFAPVWTTLYTSMGYASYLVWKEGGGFEGEAYVPLALYGTHLILNWIWTPLWFGCHALKWGMIEGLTMAGTAVACTAKFYAVSPTAGYIMLPYLAWLGVASSLMISIYLNNPDESKEEKKK